MLSRLRYTFREMWASLSRNLTLTVAAIITSAISLLLFGLTLLIQQGFDNQLAQWSGGVEMIVYVNNGATPSRSTSCRPQLLEQQPTLIARSPTATIACSVENAQRLFGGDTATLAQLGPDKIPSFFRVVPSRHADNTGRAAISSRPRIKGLPQGADASPSPTSRSTSLGALKGFFGPRTLDHVGGPARSPSALLIWNTIRTAMFARRREIEVMKLVGATNWFIRLPFMLEGLLQGIVGGALASVRRCCSSTRTGPTGVRGASRRTPGSQAFVVPGSYPWTVVGYMLAARRVRRRRRFRHRGHPLPRRLIGARPRSGDLGTVRRPWTTPRSSTTSPTHIATITLNRPDQLNAFTGTMMNEMIDAFDRIDADDDVRVVIVTGAGRGVLRRRRPVGGGEHVQPRRQRRAVATSGVPRDGGGLVTLRIFDCKKPVIGAINGAGGRRRRHDDAADGHPPGQRRRQVRVRVRPPRHRARGVLVVVPAAPRRDQPGRGVVLHRSGVPGHARRSPAAWCAACTPPDELLPAARAIAAEIADNTSPVSVALTRQMLWRMLGADHPMEAHRVDSRGILERGRERRLPRGRRQLPGEAPGRVPAAGVSTDLPDIFPDWEERAFS